MMHIIFIGCCSPGIWGDMILFWHTRAAQVVCVTPPANSYQVHIGICKQEYFRCDHSQDLYSLSIL